MKVGDIIPCEERYRELPAKEALQNRLPVNMLFGRKVPHKYKQAEVLAILKPPESDYRLFRISQTEVILVKLSP